MSISEGTEQATGWTANDSSSFGARLALIRQHMGWGNIAKAAKECGLPTDSWRNWETDGRLPQRLTTIAMTIATRTGCDVDWLLWGPHGKERPAAPNGRYVGTRVIARIAPTSTEPDSAPTKRRSHLTRQAEHASRPVAQTRPTFRDTRRPLGALSR